VAILMPIVEGTVYHRLEKFYGLWEPHIYVIIIWHSSSAMLMKHYDAKPSA
jgi:hypothetical protein